ncbi:hypothetical protein Tco_1241096 [Tanacetum coccineum]
MLGISVGYKSYLTLMYTCFDDAFECRPQVYSPSIVDWTVLNTLGCGDEIEEMLEFKVYEMGGKEVLFTFEAWRHAFDINEPIYTELCYDFYATYEFEEEVLDEELTSKKLIKFRLGGHAHSFVYIRVFSLFRELIGSNERLITEDPAPGVSRVAMPRPPRPTIQDLYDRIVAWRYARGAYAP